MKRNKSKLWLALLATVAVLTACSGSGDNGSGTSGDEGGTSAGKADPTVLVVANGADPVTFDIQATNDQATTRVAKQIYDTLIVQTNDLELVPGLATEWEEVEEFSEATERNTGGFGSTGK